MIEAHVSSVSTLQTWMKELWVVCGFNKIIHSCFEKGCSKKLCNYAIKLKGTLGNDNFIKSLLDSSFSSKCKKMLWQAIDNTASVWLNELIRFLSELLHAFLRSDNLSRNSCIWLPTQSGRSQLFISSLSWTVVIWSFCKASNFL